MSEIYFIHELYDHVSKLSTETLSNCRKRIFRFLGCVVENPLSICREKDLNLLTLQDIPDTFKSHIDSNVFVCISIKSIHMEALSVVKKGEWLFVQAELDLFPTHNYGILKQELIETDLSLFQSKDGFLYTMSALALWSAEGINLANYELSVLQRRALPLLNEGI